MWTFIVILFLLSENFDLSQEKCITFKEYFNSTEVHESNIVKVKCNVGYVSVNGECRKKFTFKFTKNKQG